MKKMRFKFIKPFQILLFSVFMCIATSSYAFDIAGIGEIISDLASLVKTVVGDMPKWFDSIGEFISAFNQTLSQSNPTDKNSHGELLKTGAVTSESTQTNIISGQNFNQYLLPSNPMKNMINAYKRPDKVTYTTTDEKGNKTTHTYSSTDSNVLFSSNIHNPGQSKASEEYVKNVNYSNMGIEHPKYDKATPSAMKASAYTKYLSAQAASASNVTLKAHVHRQQLSGFSKPTSTASHQETVAIGNSTNKDYYEETNKMGFFGKILATPNTVLSIGSSIHSTNKMVSQSSTQIANLNTQGVAMSDISVGKQYRENAKRESTPGAQFLKKGAH